MPALPRHDREPDVPEAVGRKFVGAGLPAKIDDPAEVPVPKPFVISWKTRHHRPVRKCDRWTTSGTINLKCEKSVRITPNERQLFLGSLQSEVRSEERRV